MEKNKKSSNSIQRCYKPGVFEKVINGPKGPDVRLHRNNIIIGLLKLFLIIFNTAGIILLTVIMLCITINVGYVCVQIDDINSFVQMMFFAFYFSSLYDIIRSLWRTYLRLIHTVMNSNFGSSVNDIFIKRFLGRYITKYIVSWYLPSQYESHPKDWYEKVNMMVFSTFIILILLPIPITALTTGYWGVTGTLCLLFVGGGAFTIVALNLFSRFVLFIKFFRRIDEFYYDAPTIFSKEDCLNNQTSYLRLTYCTTNNFEGGVNVLNYIINRLILVLLEVTIAAYIFGSFDPEVAKVTVILQIVAMLIPLRYRKPIYKNLYKYFVKLNIIEEAVLKEREEVKKNKTNNEMIENHQNYVKLRRMSTQMSNNISFYSFNINRNISKTNFYEEYDNNNNNKYEPNLRPPSIHSKNSYNPNTGFASNNNITNNNIIKKNEEEEKEDMENNNNNNNKNNNSNSNNIDINDSYESITNEENTETDKFYYYLQSGYGHLHRKAILSWDIKTLISWKGCLTVFFIRSVKFIIGITFMAFLHYNRYSSDSSHDTTHNNITVDIIIHFCFILLILGQDLLYITPANLSLFSMKTRKIIFIILLLIEFCFVIGTATFKMNGYIPMAFIIISYSDFLVHPDPRYNWDDESITRQTFFDLFKPEINLRSEISYTHYKKSKGFFQSKSKKKSRDKSKDFEINPENNENSNNNHGVENTNDTDDNNINKDINNKNIDDENDADDNDVNIIINNSDYENEDENEDENENNNDNNNNNNNNNDNDNNDDDNNNINDENKENEDQEKKAKKLWRMSINKQLKLNSMMKEKSANVDLDKIVSNVKKEMQYKRNRRACHNSEAILLITLLMVLFSVGLGILLADDSKNKFSNDYENGGLIRQKPTICQWKGDGISINEFSALAYACYYDTIDDITHSWAYGKPKSSTNNFVIGENSIDSTSGVHFVDFVNEERNITVVAIRGTITIEDAFQDVYIWSASALLQLSGFFGTFIKFWPRDTIALLVKIIVKQFTNSRLLYWKEVEKHVKELQDNSNHTLYLTGHSLGGGVAGVISGHLNIPAITFSSPGLGYSYKTYDIELENLINNYVNIVPMSDPVPLLDSQIGQIQNIQCNTGEPLSCHSIYNTIDTLNKMCGDSSVYRYWDKDVEDTIDGQPAYPLEA